MQRIGGHGTEFRFYSEYDWKLDSSEHRSDILRPHFLMDHWLLCREQMILGQEQKQGDQLGGHCSDSDRK